jgi:hypothetical protein
VEIGPDNNLYVGINVGANGVTGEILKLDTTGNLLATIVLPNDSGNQFLLYPFGFSVASDGTFWVPQANNAVILHLDASGNVLNSFAVGGAPEDTATESNGHILIANANLGIVQDLDPSTGNVTTFASGFSAALAVSVTPSGNVWVSDPNFSQVSEYSSTGTFITSVTDFNGPLDAQNDLSNNLFIAGFFTGTVDKYDPSGNFLLSGSIGGEGMSVAVVGVDGGTPPAPDTSDYYSFTLQAGQAVSLSISDLGHAAANIDLEDGSGNVLASGVAVGTGVSEAISNFVVTTGGTYYAHVTGNGAAYDLVVTRGATFDLKTNGTLATALDITNTGGAVGALLPPNPVHVGANFDGITSDQSNCGCSPPDTTGAVGPTNVVEGVNTALQIYDKSGNIQSYQTFQSFFSSLGTHFLSDPQVVYDPLASRWYVAILDIDFSFSFSDELLAVSVDSNPLDGFTGFQRIHIGNSDFLDFDKLGYNQYAVVITANDFGQPGTPLEVIAIDKAQYLGGTFVDFLTQRQNIFRAMVPAQMETASSTDPMYYVTEAGYENGHNVDVVTETNVLSNSPVFTDTILAVNPYGPPALANQPGGLVNTNDTTFTRANWRNNKLVSAQSVSEPDDGFSTSRVRWYEFDTSGSAPTLVQEGSINPGPGISTYYGTIALDSAGDLGVTYMESSSTEFVSMYVTGQIAGSPPGFLSPGTLAVAGNSFLDGFFRAGDYSGIQVDPSNGTTFWAFNEYKGNSFWNTYVASFHLAAGSDQDWYSVSLTAGQTLNLTTSTPADGPGEFTNNLSAGINLYDSGGNLLVAGTETPDGHNQTITFTASTTATYFIQVDSPTNTSGEYVLSKTVTGGPLHAQIYQPPSKGNHTPPVIVNNFPGFNGTPSHGKIVTPEISGTNGFGLGTSLQPSKNGTPDTVVNNNHLGTDLGFAHLLFADVYVAEAPQTESGSHGTPAAILDAMFTRHQTLGQREELPEFAGWPGL